MTKEEKKDHSLKIGVGAASTGTIATGAAVVGLTGGSASASAITYALGTIGGIVGGGMAAGLGVIIGGPLVLGAAAYGITKAVNKKKNK